MFPYEIKPIDGSVGEELVELFKGVKTGFLEVGPKKWILPAEYAKHAEKYYNFELKKDDVWIMTFPRSGTTLMQEILWLINNKFDYETAAKVPIIERSPFIEYNLLFNEPLVKEIAELNGNDPQALEELEIRKTPGYVYAEKLKPPRCLKTHLPFSLMPPTLLDTCKVIYLARNPFDVAVSFYHHNKMFKGFDYSSDFEKYWELFEKDLMYSPYWQHIKEAAALRSHPNLLFLFYEDLLKDLPSNLKKISKFLNKQMSDEEIKRLSEHVQIDNFRKNVPFMRQNKIIGLVNKNTQGFVRRGKTGGNEEFNSDIKLRADKWFKENLTKIDIKFPEL